MKVGIVGLGLIGGSIALDLKSQINVTVYGVDQDKQHCDKALRLGLVHEITNIEDIARDADVIIIATPVDVIELLLPEILNRVGLNTVVIDVGSTKSDICNIVKNHKKRSQFVAAHPLAGTEFSGPEAALKGLFIGAKNIICEKEESSANSLSIALKVFDSIGMNTLFMTAEEHDRHLAYVSHLSHVTSFCLGLTVLEIEKDEKQIFNLASTGFRSTSRLAKSNPHTWKAIFGRNRKYLGEALDGYIHTLTEFKNAIEENDLTKMEGMMMDANDIKRILN